VISPESRAARLAADLPERECDRPGCVVIYQPKTWHQRYCSKRCRLIVRRSVPTKYGVRHRQLRARWNRRVQRGEVLCAKCGLLIEPGTTWDLGHVPSGGPADYRGPEHSKCNRATQFKKPESQRIAGDLRTSREW
jgi:hypothetical protein